MPQIEENSREESPNQVQRADWEKLALCALEGCDPEMFFPISPSALWAQAHAEKAKAVCRRCVVRDACLQTALDQNRDHGIWGGLTEDERKALRRRAVRGRIRKQ
jgi:WhiB family redox-sensing transcriptional regulator